ncbi:DNA polymerase III, epsilon subunit [Plesiocystis pacifica SIR-1]|uniref:ribonuclease H n=1 Tax=Plesiocystis pacifica SIR-1 TaxID=391625 RepID=A6GJD7_9BACT|nr:ribonuclease H [Plesiocystis pacifica]EDM74027.1 DNA polymerase III, epsilon subunit [Plesiocystis pacifica SIR-1]
MPWKAFEFRGDKVWVRVLATGKPIVRRGLVELRYKKGATKSYRTPRENIEDLPSPTEDESAIISDQEWGGGKASTPANKIREQPKVAADADTIIIHTDGACSGNPGPAGLGVHIVRPDSITEISEFIGDATNNVAELKAILRALEAITDEEKERRIHLYTDSGWSLGVLIGGWKAKKNVALIEKIKTKLPELPNIELLKVKGHAGLEGNEEADALATKAVRIEDSSIKQRPRRR